MEPVITAAHLIHRVTPQTRIVAIFRNPTQRYGHRLNNPVNTKHWYNICTMLDQRRRRWSNIVQMLYK